MTGPKFSGKSTMCEQYDKSLLVLKTTNTIQLVESDSKAALIGDNPRIIDEWQKAPELWNVIKAFYFI